ncbi:MAG: dual specificity protein phosphatase family protein [Planctomycetota bacterium]|nr:MAG: dual specificity protein phosphatase family protein [Planctomycetota bacterium]
MNQIKPHPLWVGHAGDGQALRQLFADGIKAVVHLAAEEPPLQLPRELIYYRFPLVDGPGNDADLLQLAFGSVAGLLKKEIPTLICCGGGMSRSPVVAAAALAMVAPAALEDCLKKVADYHRTDVSPGLWAEVHHVFTSGSFGAA